MSAAGMVFGAEDELTGRREHTTVVPIGTWGGDRE
jgi:hypothetical protein